MVEFKAKKKNKTPIKKTTQAKIPKEKKNKTIDKFISIVFNEWIEELAQNHINGYIAAASRHPDGKTARDVDRSRRLIDKIKELREHN